MRTVQLNISIKIILLFFLFLLTGADLIYSQEVNREQADKVANNFITFNSDHFPTFSNNKELSFSSIITQEKAGNPYYYVFNIEGGGFVIVSAEDLLSPILGYSYTGNFINEGQSCNVHSWMKNYISMIDAAREDEHSRPGYIRKQWETLLQDGIHISIAGQDPPTRWEVEPLIKSTWDQDIPYNTLCPDDSEGPGGRCVTGCVATALAQIMYYWRYPLVGSGSKSYSLPGYGLLSADFANTYYRWSAMKDELTNSSGSAPIYAVSQLQYHVGVATEMYYQPDGSSTTNSKAIDALKTYFNYSESASIAEREFFDPTSWEALLKNNLDNGRPVYYAGNNGDLGHAFVCDGYETGEVTYFHFNFGWGGNNNGYYWIDDPFGFTNDQVVIRNIFPDYNNYTYPYFCSGPSYITAPAGSFGDGSGPVEDYKDNSSCSWIITPQNDSVTYFTIGFDQFDVAEGDTVTIYDGSSVDHDILGMFSGNQLPNGFTTTGAIFLVTFKTNNNGTSPGWQLNWRGHLPDYCDGILNVSEPSGTINDGSGSKNYTENSLCRWKIDIPGAEKITFGITEIDTEEKYDYIHVHDLSTNPASELGKFSGNSVPAPVTGKGPLLITFRTNNCINKPGWKAYYTNGEAGVPESMISDLNVYPNPVTDVLNITFDLKLQSKIRVELVNNLGIIVKKYSFDSQQGTNQGKIFIGDLKAGIFVLRLIHPQGSTYRRIIIL